MVQFTLKKPYETKSSVMTAISKYQLERWSKQFSDLDLQIFRLSLACKIDLRQMGMVDSVIANNDLSDRNNKPQVFMTLRGLLILRLLLQSKASSELGSHAAVLLARDQLDRMYKRAGRRRSYGLNCQSYPWEVNA
jgi:hypothetical protein